MAKAKPTLPKPVKDFPIEQVMETLRQTVAQWPAPVVTEMAKIKANPFKILISTILSLRTKDLTTAQASVRLYCLAQTPSTMLKLSATQIEQAIFPVGFYRTKAQTILDVCATLLERHAGQVPRELDALLELKGVGRKTANLVLTLGWGLPGICVDTHVHRITNRWGYVSTATPEQTEMALRAALPPQYWIPINDWLVAYGQQLCKPLSPHCSGCPLAPHCARRGVGRHR